MARKRNVDKEWDGEWLDVELAFRAFELHPRWEDDRRAWFYFASPVVGAAYETASGWCRIEGPYHVVVDGRAYRVEPALPQADPIPSEATWAFAGDDIRYILENVPFLFDSIGATALHVGGRHVVWRQWREPRDLPPPVAYRLGDPIPAEWKRRRSETGLARDHDDVMVMKNRARLAERIRSMEPGDPRRRELIERILASTRRTTGLTNDALLDTHANLTTLLPEMVAVTWDRIADCPGIFQVLGEPWPLETNNQKATVMVTPPFMLRDPAKLPAVARGRDWLDDYVQEWKALEKAGRAVGFGELQSAIAKHDRAEQEWMTLPPAYSSPFTSASMPAGRSGVSGDPVGRSAEGTSDKIATQSEDSSPYVEAVFQNIRSRRSAFLRADKRKNEAGSAELVGYYLPTHGGCIICGRPVYKVHERGRGPSYCIDEACQDAGRLNEARRRRASRQAQRRRDLP